MRIPRHNWETQQLDYIEYPDSLFQPFLEWLLTTSAWQEDHSRVEAKVRMLERAMADYRNPPDTHREAEAFLTQPLEDARITEMDPGITEESARRVARAERNRENLAKARAARAEKKRAKELARV
jgi:hypothetical protein